MEAFLSRKNYDPFLWKNLKYLLVLSIIAMIPIVAITPEEHSVPVLALCAMFIVIIHASTTLRYADSLPTDIACACVGKDFRNTNTVRLLFQYMNRTVTHINKNHMVVDNHLVYVTKNPTHKDFEQSVELKNQYSCKHIVFISHIPAFYNPLALFSKTSLYNRRRNELKYGLEIFSFDNLAHTLYAMYSDKLKGRITCSHWVLDEIGFFNNYPDPKQTTLN